MVVVDNPYKKGGPEGSTGCTSKSLTVIVPKSSDQSLAAHQTGPSQEIVVTQPGQHALETTQDDAGLSPFIYHHPLPTDIYTRQGTPEGTTTPQEVTNSGVVSVTQPNFHVPTVEPVSNVQVVGEGTARQSEIDEWNRLSQDKKDRILSRQRRQRRR